jgi:hypothetical protein
MIDSTGFLRCKEKKITVGHIFRLYLYAGKSLLGSIAGKHDTLRQIRQTCKP